MELGVKQLIIPKQLRNRVMELAHNAKMSGHLGLKKTQDRIKSCFYWPGIHSEIRRYCKSCVMCQKTISRG